MSSTIAPQFPEDKLAFLVPIRIAVMVAVVHGHSRQKDNTPAW